MQQLPDRSLRYLECGGRSLYFRAGQPAVFNDTCTSSTSRGRSPLAYMFCKCLLIFDDGPGCEKIWTTSTDGLSKVPAFMEGFTTGSFKGIPGLTPAITAVGVRAYELASADAYETVLYHARLHGHRHHYQLLRAERR